MNVSSAYLAVVIIWATTPLAVKWSSVGLDPVSGLFFRMLISAMVGWLLLKILRLPLRLDKQAIHGYLAANLGIVGCMGLVYWGATKIPSGIVSVIFGMAPIISGLLANRFLGEKAFSILQWLALLLALVGLSMIFAGDADTTALDPLGVIIMLGAVILFSCSGVWVKSVASEAHPLSHTVGALIFSVPVLFVVWMVLVGEFHQASDVKAYAAILYLSIGGSLFGFVCYYFVLSRLAIGKVNLINLLTPMLAMMIGMFVEGETLGFNALLGVGLICFGLMLFLVFDRPPKEEKSLQTS